MKRVGCILMLLVGMFASAESLRDELFRIVSDVDACVGVAVIADGDTVTIGNHRRYPLMSVVKFHQALFVADYIRNHGDTVVVVEREDLRDDTYSPLREQYPAGGIRMSATELVDYAMRLSDNNACDILFRAIGSPVVVDGYIRSLGVADFEVAATEAEMHDEPRRCADNNSTPLAMAELLSTAIVGADDETQRVVLTPMRECATGQRRLAAGLVGTDVSLLHKTGTGGPLDSGKIVGINDVGVVTFPDGRRYVIAVFVTDAAESLQRCEQVIAEVSSATFQWFSNKK